MIGILEHMLRYPEAKDTADGIRRWWLSTEEHEFTHEQVRQALDCLTQRGWIVESSFGDDTRVYGISAAGLDEGAVQIERFRR